MFGADLSTFCLLISVNGVKRFNKDINAGIMVLALFQKSTKAVIFLA